MDGLFPPMALYAAFAVSVTVTARVTTGSAGGDSQFRFWESWLLHVPVLVAWLHLLGYLFWRIGMTQRFDRVNLIIHLAAMVTVGLAGTWIYFRQFSKIPDNSGAV